MKILRDIESYHVFTFIYMFLFVITFGHTWHKMPQINDITFYFIKGLLSLISSVFWPLYWSVQAWS